MRFIFFLLHLSLFAADFDCILVGSSPFSLFEALYQCHSGKKVLILEADSRCGGAWKGIDVCGVAYADLGCHQVGQNVHLKSFIEEYAGCHIVSMDNPLLPFESGKSKNGWYFSKGCYELIDHLLTLIAQTDITLLTEHKVEKVSVDLGQKIAIVQTKNRLFTTDQLILTPMSSLSFHPSIEMQNFKKSKYFHLYLLVQDPTEPRFTYRAGGAQGVSRMMNLSHFTGLAGTGRHLIVIQTHNEQSLANGQAFLDALKKNHLIDQTAYILKEESYIYETGTLHQGLIAQMGAQEIIQILQTGHFDTISQYIPKWKKAMKPYNSMF